MAYGPDMDRVRARVTAGLMIAVPVGFLGAWAFNPDNGVVFHNEVLWRSFGIMFEAGLLLLIILGLLSLVFAVAARVLQARRSRHA